MKKKIKLFNLEKKRPLKITKDGKYITIENSLLNKSVDEVKLEVQRLNQEIQELDYQKKKKLTLERYKMIPEEDKKVEHVIGVRSYTRQQNIEEIEKDSDYGKELIEIELMYLSRILKKFEDGEIE